METISLLRYSVFYEMTCIKLLTDRLVKKGIINMSRPQQVSSEAIIKVARKHFLSKGHSASLKGISKDLGISHSALIQRFGTKRKLLLEALRPKEYVVWVPKFLDGPPQQIDKAIQDLHQQCLLLFSFLEEHMPSIRVLQAAEVTPYELFGGQLPFPLLAFQRISAWIQSGIDQGVFTASHPQSVASMIMGSIFARIELYDLYMLTNECEYLPKISKYEDILGSMDNLMEQIKGLLISDTLEKEKADA